jgi:hypothetical protein
MEFETLILEVENVKAKLEKVNIDKFAPLPDNMTVNSDKFHTYAFARKMPFVV